MCSRAARDKSWGVESPRASQLESESAAIGARVRLMMLTWRLLWDHRGKVKRSSPKSKIGDVERADAGDRLRMVCKGTTSSPSKSSACQEAIVRAKCLPWLWKQPMHQFGICPSDVASKASTFNRKFII